ncbi:MAG: DciA family protein [Flavobacteriales bacterium]
MKQPIQPFDGLAGRRPGGLRSLQQQIKQLEQMTQQILPLLPAGECWQVAAYEDGILCIAAQHHAAASRLRYLQQQYVEQIKTLSAFADLQGIKVIIEPLPSPRYTSPNRLPALSAESRQVLLEAATLFDDPELNQAMLRIASKK